MTATPSISKGMIVPSDESQNDETNTLYMSSAKKVRPHTIIFLSKADYNYQFAVDVYKDSEEFFAIQNKKVVSYWEYSDKKTDSPLYFVQFDNGQFFLMLANDEFETYSLEEIVMELIKYNN